MKNLLRKEIKFGNSELRITIGCPYNRFFIGFSKCGYFDGRPRFEIALVLFAIEFIFPWINKKWEDECDPPRYGIEIHSNTFWIYRGGEGNMKGGCKWWTWNISWFTKNFYKHYILGKNDEWIDVTYHKWDSPERKWVDENIGHLEFNPNFQTIDDEHSLAKTYYGIWDDKYDGKQIDAKYRVEKRIWRPKWFMWTSKFQIIEKSIDVAFKEEVGSQKGSWKGGVLGAGIAFKDDTETPQECFKRMNEEKNY